MHPALDPGQRFLVPALSCTRPSCRERPRRCLRSAAAAPETGSLPGMFHRLSPSKHWPLLIGRAKKMQQESCIRQPLHPARVAWPVQPVQPVQPAGSQSQTERVVSHLGCSEGLKREQHPSHPAPRADKARHERPRSCSPHRRPQTLRASF